MKTCDCRSRTVRIAALLALALLTLGGTARAQFSLASLNCLHLGWGSQQNQTAKDIALRNFFTPPNQSPPYDVIVLQEVMSSANRVNVGNVVAPGIYQVEVTDPLGPGSYKERYAFLVNRNNVGLGRGAQSMTPGFSRPPTGIAIMEGGRCTWVINYHAIFGRSKAQRLAEARLIPLVINEFLGKDVRCDRVVIAGDWNLSALEVATSTGLNITRISPILPTSLKRTGELSQPYDHFLAGGRANLSNVQVSGPRNQQLRQQWRQQVSDHLPITCTVN